MVDNFINYAKPDGTRPLALQRADSVFSILLSGLVILGLPALFWFSVLEFLNYVFSFGLSGGNRLAFVGVFVGLLAIIWTSVRLTTCERIAERQAFRPLVAPR